MLCEEWPTLRNSHLVGSVSLYSNKMIPRIFVTRLGKLTCVNLLTNPVACPSLGLHSKKLWNLCVAQTAWNICVKGTGDKPVNFLYAEAGTVRSRRTEKTSY